MEATLAREIMLDALLMAICWRKLKQQVLVRSAQYGSDEGQPFSRSHMRQMSRHGSCRDKAVVESLTPPSMKRGTKHVYKIRDWRGQPRDL